MKRFGSLILIAIAALILINFGPVWFQRIFGFYAKVEKVTYPQWINNEEYCYVRVINYYDADLTWSMLPRGFNPLFMFRGPNATFSIYKANINKPTEQKLLKKITTKVSFSIPEVYKKIDGSEFTFRRLDNGELILLIRGRLQYIAYYLNANGKLFKKRIFDYDFIEGDSISDISPDGEKILLGAYVKEASSGQKVLLGDKWHGPIRWISKDDLIYYTKMTDSKTYPYKVKYEIYLIAYPAKEFKLVCSKDYLEYSEYHKNYKELPSFLDATFSLEQNLLFLSKIGIFKKEGEKWQEIKDLRDMEFNLYYPDWSPDGKRLVGVLNNKNIKVIELKDLLKE